MDFIMTFDVERHSFERSCSENGVADRVETEAMPHLLACLDKYGMKATFFFTARFAQLSPSSVSAVQTKGHEIACHGYDHSDYYDVMDLSRQVEFMKKSKDIIETVSGSGIVSFRAPALRINKFTVEALEKTGFKYDSSVSSQRFDGPFTTGAIKKLKWLTARRTPYYMSYDSPFRQGSSPILEVPVSAVLWPFVGTHLRICPSVTRMVRRLLIFENRFIDKPLVFLFHPQECLEFKKGKPVKSAGRGHFLIDRVKHSLKMRNLGDKALLLVESILVSPPGTFTFKTIREMGG